MPLTAWLICLLIWLQKAGKAVAELDLPPHLLNKQASSAPSKPPLGGHQHTTSGSSKATVLPIPMTGQTQATSTSKNKRVHEQSPSKAQARASEEESPMSSRSTPSGKGKHRSVENKCVSGKPEIGHAASPAVTRKVVPIKLDRMPKQADQQAGSSQASSRQSSDAGEPQVQYHLTLTGVFELPKDLCCGKL